jgi:NAD-dependent deacetylase
LTGDQDIVVLTGAGISKESGLDTFRDSDGIWARVSIEDVATPEAFARDADRVHEFYNARRRGLAHGGIEPNAAHRALARLEAEWPGKVLVVTQNIDDLHERAGTENLIHMHGELLRARCGACADVVACTGDLGTGDICRNCRAPGRMRPHVVWFGEMPFLMEDIYDALCTCALFVSIGTSGNVYPASGFVENVRLSGAAHTAELNLEPTERASRFADARYGPATDVVPAYVDKILDGGW